MTVKLILLFVESEAITEFEFKNIFNDSEKIGFELLKP